MRFTRIRFSLERLNQSPELLFSGLDDSVDEYFPGSKHGGHILGVEDFRRFGEHLRLKRLGGNKDAIDWHEQEPSSSISPIWSIFSPKRAVLER